MKELISIEQKAKRYDEALKQIKEYIPDENGFVTIYPNEIFPELKEESEDEKIMKEIISYIKSSGAVTNKEWIAWLEKQGKHANFRNKIQIGDKVTMNRDGVLVNLSQLNRVAKKDEKQGEQKKSYDTCDSSMMDNKKSPYGEKRDFGYFEEKSTDKVEPKFKVGDWVVHDMSDGKKIIRQIVNMTNKSYVLNGEDFNTFYFKNLENDYHLWTIQDAKDGDVLCCESGWTCIFKVLNSDISFSSYCFMDHTGWFCGTESESHTLDKVFFKAYMGNIYPATKEQRDLLFQKMKEAGYEWDAEKKELKKVEQKAAENEELTEFDKAVGVIIGTWNPKTPEQIQSVKAASKKLLKLAKKQINDEQKPEWSEEDKEQLDRAIYMMEQLDMTKSWDDVYNWLKSLRSQNRWKPSDEQMTALRRMKAAIAGEGEIYKPLNSLYEDLKKLREE